MRVEMEELLYSYGVDIVFNGHVRPLSFLKLHCFHDDLFAVFHSKERSWMKDELNYIQLLYKTLKNWLRNCILLWTQGSIFMPPSQCILIIGEVSSHRFHYLVWPTFNIAMSHHSSWNDKLSVRWHWILNYMVILPSSFPNIQVHAYERSNRVYNYLLDPCGPIYITVGDGGNREKMAVGHADDPGECPEPSATYDVHMGGFCAFNFTSGPAAGKFCWDRQPDYSAYRESSFGHGILEVDHSFLC